MQGFRLCRKIPHSRHQKPQWTQRTQRKMQEFPFVSIVSFVVNRPSNDPFFHKPFRPAPAPQWISVVKSSTCSGYDARKIADL